MENTYGKMVAIYYQELQITIRRRYTMQLLEQSQSRTLTPPNAGKDIELPELSFITGENAMAATLKTVWQVLTKPDILTM